MIAEVFLDNKNIKVDLAQPLPLAIQLRTGSENVNAFYIPPVKKEPFHAGTFIGDVNQGGSCNVFTITFNPHGNGTHTETVGHISKEAYPVGNYLKKFFFEARLITISPIKHSGDLIIDEVQLKQVLGNNCPAALVIRTLPNSPEKINHHYSGKNPPYLTEQAALFLRSLDVKHLILDLPSIDREEDGGKLLAHHAFWNYPLQPRVECTITELAYIPDSIEDGHYLLNLMIAHFDNDASPGMPVLYKIM